MDTQRPAEHGLLAWFLSIMQGKAHQDSGWQRERGPEQETGGYELPGLLDGIVGGAHWDGAPGTWVATYRGQHTGYTPIPPTPQDTGEVRLPVSPLRERARLRGISEVPTDRQLPGPEWLFGQLPANALPPHVGNAPVLRQPLTNTGRLDAMLLTLRPDRLREEAQLPQIYELPTVKSHESVVSRALEALPPQLPLPEPMVAAFEDDTWLNDAPAPKLVPLATDAIAATDRITEVATPALDALATLAQGEPDEDTKEVPAFMRQKHEKKESENNMSEIHMGVIVAARIVAKQMTTDELVAINIAAQLELDPRNNLGYDKAKSLFTENGGTLMHRDTRVALATIVNERLAKEGSE